jgi:hypothetical protein
MQRQPPEGDAVFDRWETESPEDRVVTVLLTVVFVLVLAAIGTLAVALLKGSAF